MNQRIERRTALLAASVAALGATAVVVLFVVQVEPSPLWLLGILAAAFAALEFYSVEVNDRLFISSSIMVAFAGAVVFGRDSAVLAVVLMAAISVLQPQDLRLRRWRQPAFNFGQLVLSSAIGVLVLIPFLPSGDVVASDLPQLTLGALIAAGVYDWVNFRLVSLYKRIGYPDDSLLPWSRVLGNQLIHAVLGAYGALLGAAYLLVGPISLPLMLITFLVGHVGFVSYSRLRIAHEDAVSGFVKAVEALDPYTRGHTERVADFCRITGETLGLGPEELDVLRWAAMIHDVGKLAAPPDLVRREGPLSQEDQERLARRVALVEDLLSRVEFLAPAVAAVSAAGGTNGDRSQIARVVGAADAFDLMTTTRSYKAAVTQSEAFAELRSRSDELGPEVVEALIGAIEGTGKLYGSPDAESVAEVERLVRERARRA